MRQATLKGCVVVALAMFVGTPAVADDPAALVWSTFLGGSSEDVCLDVQADASGNVYLAGLTLSLDFPATAGAFQMVSGGSMDGFVAQLSPNGDGLLFSTFLGGNQEDGVYGLYVDAVGDVYVIGDTESADFPVTPGAYDTTHNGGGDVFVAKLSATGDALLFSTYLGGSDEDESGITTCIVLDGAGNVCVAGKTSSTDFPSTPGAYDTSYNGGTRDSFVAKLAPDASALLCSTFLGGSDWDRVEDLAVTPSGDIVVTGRARSTDFPTTPGAYDTTHNGLSRDSFATRLSSDCTGLVYSTFLSGPAASQAITAWANALGPLDEVYITGNTSDPGFPVTPGAFDTTHNGGRDTFVAILNASGSSLVAATFLGGTADDSGYDITLDSAGNVWVGGRTWSTDLPTTAQAYDNSFNGASDVYVACLDPLVSTLSFSSYLGGPADDSEAFLDVDLSGCVYLAGLTESPSFPVTPGAWDTSYNGGGDIYVAKLGLFVHDTTPPTIEVILTPDRLWPPNHRMVEITPAILVWDDVDPNPTVSLKSITVSEGDNDVGDGNTTGDVYVDPHGRIFLRAERSGKGPGRTYTITYEAVDASGNTAEASATVVVPHSKKG